MDPPANPVQSLPVASRLPSETIAFAVMVTALVVAPFFTYPLFLMQVMCFALFACAFNLLIGYVGLLSFGHALYFGWASYLAAYSAKAWGLTPELAILTGTATAAVCGFLTGFALGIIEGLTKVFFPEASNTVIFVIMAIVLLVRPAGLFGRHA